MKGFVAIWLLAAGVGVSYSVVAERRNMLRQLGEMEHSLKRLAYYMYQWRMPVKEAVVHAAKEEQGILYDFYLGIQERLAERQSEDFGIVWQEESRYLWEQQEGSKKKSSKRESLNRSMYDWNRKLPEEIGKIWSDSFVHIPMEPEALNKRLTERAEKLADYTRELQEKYKGEQRLVFTMGFFVSAFFCLILW